MIAENTRFVVWTDRLMAAMPSDARIVTTCTLLHAQARPAFIERVQAWVGQTYAARILESL